MNVIWSKYVQGVNTLYDTRKLRFHDMFAALHRWYPNAEITAIDRDSTFISFAKKSVQTIN